MAMYYAEWIHRTHDILKRLQNCLPFTGYPLSDDAGYDPFFIVGSGRSGSTLLRRMLIAHPDVYIPPESWVLGRCVKLWRQHPSLTWRDRVYLILAQFEYTPRMRERGWPELAPVAQRLLAVEPKARSLARIIDMVYRFSAEQDSDCRRWGDKTPLSTFSLPRIRSVFPSARFIHLIRDGCDVTFSYLQAGRYHDLKLAARRWAAAAKLASRFCRRHSDQCIEIRYEQLVTKPEETLRQVCGLLDLEFIPRMIESEDVACRMKNVSKTNPFTENVLRPVFADSIGKGRRALSADQRQLIAPIIGKELARLGYDPCS